VVYLHNGVLFSHKRVLNYVVFRQMNRTGDHVKPVKPGSGEQKAHVFLHMWKNGPKEWLKQ
jgi:hypothetical protein